VTGMDLPSSSKNWDMPSFFPRMPMDIRREKRQQDHQFPGERPAGNGVAVRGAQSGPDQICGSRMDRRCRTKDRI